MNVRFYYNIWGIIRLLNKHKFKPYKAVLYFALYICHDFNFLSTLGSKSLVFLPFRPSLIFSISFCFYLISLLNFFIAYLKNILTAYYLVSIYTYIQGIMANISDLTFMLFVGLHTLKVKLFFENSLLSNILNHLKQK